MTTKRTIDQMFQTDKKAEQEEGIIIDYGSFRVRIVRAGGANKKFNRILDYKMKPYQRQLKNDSMDDEVATRIMAECYAEAVILGMDVAEETEVDGEMIINYVVGILRSEGVLEFTKENVIRTLIEMPDFFRDLQEQASKAALFRAHELEDDVKN